MIFHKPSNYSRIYEAFSLLVKKKKMGRSCPPHFIGKLFHKRDETRDQVKDPRNDYD